VRRLRLPRGRGHPLRKSVPVNLPEPILPSRSCGHLRLPSAAPLHACCRCPALSLQPRAIAAIGTRKNIPRGQQFRIPFSPV
jgi:hypothetical protein